MHNLGAWSTISFQVAIKHTITRIVMDGLEVSMSPGQDEGHNSVATGAHSEVAIDGISEVADAGEILCPKQVTSSAVVQVPPLHLAALQPASPPTIRIAIPTGSSRSIDDSELEGAQRGTTKVSTPNTSTRAQEHSSAGETDIFATPGEVQPKRRASSPPIPRICTLNFAWDSLSPARK
jgi:hypothetical protein